MIFKELIMQKLYLNYKCIFFSINLQIYTKKLFTIKDKDKLNIKKIQNFFYFLCSLLVIGMYIIDY